MSQYFYNDKVKKKTLKQTLLQALAEYHVDESKVASNHSRTDQNDLCSMPNVASVYSLTHDDRVTRIIWPVPKVKYYIKHDEGWLTKLN